MKLLKTFSILAIILLLSGCAASGLKIIRDKQGRIVGIEKTGFFPVKGSISDTEASLDTKMSILNIDFQGIKNAAQ